MRKIEKVRFYRTGQIVRDIGIISFYEYLKAIDKDDLDINLMDNYLEFNEFSSNRITEYLKEKSIFSIPYIQNSIKFGAVNGPKEGEMYRNIQNILDICFKINNKNIEQQEEILKNYEPIGECSVCNSYLSTKKHYSIKDNGIVDKIDDKAIYSFIGSQKNTFNNFSKENQNICFTCELINLFFLLYIDNYKLNIIGYCEKLRDLHYVNYKLILDQKIKKEDALYLGMAKIFIKSIKIYKIERHPKKGLLLKFNSIIDVENLIKKLLLINIVYNYNFNVKNDSKNRYLDNIKEHLKQLIINDNYFTALQILLSNLISTDSDNIKKANFTVKNINWFNKFLEGGFNVELKKSKANVFYELGSKLGKKIDNEKNKTIAFRLVQLMKSDSREQLFDELIHLLVNYEVEIPKYFSDSLLKTDSVNFHYNIGKMLEGLNSKELTENIGGEDNEE